MFAQSAVSIMGQHWAKIQQSLEKNIPCLLWNQKHRRQDRAK